MRLINETCRLVLFFFGALAGLQVPGFIDQYGQTLNAHLEEARYSLSRFEDEADLYFDGDMQALIAYYRNSDDRVFRAGGMSLSELYDRYRQLSAARQAFSASWYEAFLHVALTPHEEIRSETWQEYDYAVVLTPLALGWSMVAGLVMAALGALLGAGTARAGRVLLPGRRTGH